MIKRDKTKPQYSSENISVAPVSHIGETQLVLPCLHEYPKCTPIGNQAKIDTKEMAFAPDLRDG